MTRPSPSVPTRLPTPLLVGVGVVLATLSAVGFGASTYGADEIGLSRDGENWDDWDPLFDADVRWVPGDALLESFYVRNQGPTSGELVVEFVIDDSDGLVAQEELNLRARIEGEDWQPLVGDLPGLPALSLDRGQVVQVDVEASLRWEAPNTTVNDQVSIDIRTTLRGIEAPDGPPTEPGAGPDPSGLFPHTGSDLSKVIWLAALAIVTGLALVLRSRRAEAEQ